MRRLETYIVLAPTDLGNFLSCRHLSHRDLAAAVFDREILIRRLEAVDHTEGNCFGIDTEVLGSSVCIQHFGA